MGNIINTPSNNLIPLIIDKDHLIMTGFLEHFNILLNDTIYNIYYDISTNELVFQRDGGDLKVDFSLSKLPDVDTTNLLAGHVLVYDGTKWVSQTLETTMPYVRPATSSRFTDVTNITSIVDALDKILYPYVAPTINGFSVAGKSTFELGQYFSTISGGNETFNWSVTKIENISLTQGFTITDNTNATTLTSLPILPNTMTSSVLSVPYSIRYTSIATHVFGISTKDIKDTTISRTASYTWLPKIYFGTSPLTTLTSSQVVGLQSSRFASSLVQDFTISGGGEYIWICTPVILGVAMNADGSNTRFVVGGLPNSFWDRFEIPVTNAQGYTSQHYLYKSKTVSFGTNTSIKIV